MVLPSYVAVSNFYNKGQAFVVFKDVASATKAMNGLQALSLLRSKRTFLK